MRAFMRSPWASEAAIGGRRDLRTCSGPFFMAKKRRILPGRRDRRLAPLMDEKAEWKQGLRPVAPTCSRYEAGSELWYL